MTYFELASKDIHITLILVVLLRIAPNVTDFFLEHVPGLEVSRARRWCSAMLTTTTLSDAFERDWMSNNFVVVL